MRDLDYLLDDAGVFLLVKGDHHPPGKVRAYPVFWPDSGGERQHADGFYSKRTSDWDNEEYFRRDPASRPDERLLFPQVSGERVRARYRPQEATAPLLERLEEGRWRTLLETLAELVGPAQVGALGSTLVGLDRRRDGALIKDIDLSVHGRMARAQLRDEIDELRARMGATPISHDHVAYHARKFGAPFAAGLTSWEETLARKWSSLQLAPGLLATVRCAYLPGEEPGDPLATPVVAKDVVTAGTVVDDADVDFMPRRFTVTSADGEVAIASYFWGHQSCVRAGDRVSVTGDRRADGTVTVSLLTHGVRIEK